MGSPPAASDQRDRRSTEDSPSAPVFISYSSHDSAVAQSVCTAIEAQGTPCWIAPRNITPGGTWSEAIIEGLDGCSVMVLIFSSHSQRSKQVMREVSLATARDVSIVPLRIENVKPSGGLEYFLSSQHWLDAFPPPLTRHLSRLVAVVERCLSGATGPLTPPADPQEQWEEISPDDWNRRKRGARGWLGKLFEER